MSELYFKDENENFSPCILSTMQWKEKMAMRVHFLFLDKTPYQEAFFQNDGNNNWTMDHPTNMDQKSTEVIVEHLKSNLPT